jgi:RNA polymerase sigma-70 factor (ECF subfamily)
MTFEETYRAHFKFVWRSLRRLGVRDAEVQDACQEVFVVVHERLATFEHRSRMTTWLFGICFRVARARSRRAYRSHEVSDDAAVLDAPSDLPDALWVLERRAALEMVERILGGMSLEQRAVFVLFELEEMSGEEIADALEIPVGTVRSRLRLARESFRASLQRIKAKEESWARAKEAS